MKHKFSTIMMFSLMLAGSLSLTACGDDDLGIKTGTTVNGVTLEAFGPCPVTRGGSMEVLGSNLGNVNKVLFPKGNQRVTETNEYEEASFKLDEHGKLIVTVPDNVVPGKLRLVVGNDTIVSLGNITYSEESKIENVSLSSNDMRAGDIITITGEYVWNIVSVTFADDVEVLAEDFLVNTRNEIQVAVPLAAVSGEVTYYDGNANKIQETLVNNLTLRQATISRINNESPALGDQIVVYGKDLDLIGCANFPFVDSVKVEVNEAGTELTCVVPEKTTPGDINFAQYSTKNVVVPFTPLMVEVPETGSVTPAENLNAGDEVTITGSRLNLVQYIILPGGLALASDEYSGSATQIKFTVPEGMGDGEVTLVQHENYSVKTPKIAMYHAGNIDVIWSGSWVCSGWNGNQDLAWGAFDWSQVAPGTQMVIKFTLDESASWWQMRVADGGWGALPGTDDPYDLAGLDQLVITLTPEMLGALQNNNGLVFTGTSYTLTQVGFIVPEQVIWSGTFDGSGWKGFEALDWGKYDWSTFELGQSIVVTFASTSADLGWGCICFNTAGDGWPALSIGQVDFAGSPDDQTITFTPTAEDIDRLNTENGLVLQGDGFILKKIVIQ